MSWQYWLGPGDGPIDGAMDLNDGLKFAVEQGSWSATPDGNNLRIEMRLNIVGTSRNDVLNARTEIQHLFWQAREGIGPHRHISGIVHSINIEQDEWAYADVLSGTVAVPGNAALPLEFNWLKGVVLTLTCRRYFRGERVVNALTQENVTSGTQLYLPSVAGTAPAIARMILTDTSTNSEVINRVRVGGQGLSSGQYSNDAAFTNALTAVAGVETDGDGTDTHGESYSTITAQSEWQSVASLASPTVRTSGLYDLYLRWRDHAAILGTPQTLTLAGGAIARVQGSGRASGEDQVESITNTWLQPTIAGNLLEMQISCGNVTITPPAGWVLAAEAGASAKTAIYYKENAVTESGNVTVEFSAPTVVAEMRITEWAGIAASALDDAASNSGSGSTASTGTTDATVQANELVLARWTSTGRLAHTTLTQGYTYGGRFTFGNLATYKAHKVATATGAQSASMDSDSGSWSAVIAAFKGATAAAPTVPTGVYQVRVTALDADGNESLSSFPASITLNEIGAINGLWTVPTVGTVAQYRFYLNNGSGWNYWDTGSDAPQFLLTTLDSPTGSGDPPVSSSLRSEVRALIGVGSGSVTRPTRGRSSQIANGEWELTYLDTVHLPPDAALEDDEERDWTTVIQVRNDALTPDVDLDAIILRPHNGCAVDAEYVDSDGVHMNLDSLHDWTIDTRRDGRTSVVLSASSVDAAGAQHSGAFCLLPGDNSILVMLDSIGGVNELESTEATVRIDYTPRWDWLPGQDWGG